MTISWDGKVQAYIPGKKLRIDKNLKFHDRISSDIDPITYEVLRHALWNINIEHGLTIGKVSGSPIALYAHDFNPAMFTEDGEWVYFGPFLQYLCAASQSAVKWVLENRSSEPGIQEGDMFLTNDPWIGVNHQQDVCMVAPVFLEGELFAWVANSLHQYDLGGTTPGSFCPDAFDVFSEANCIPPVKIVEGGKIRKDVEDWYLRNSRLPQLVGLDLRAIISGCNVAKQRLLALVKRYGAEVVKGVMRKISDASELAFVKRLEQIPDGIWRDRVYLEVALPGDRNSYELCLQLEKKGDKLIFSNEGTAKQTGSLNCTFLGWNGAIMTGIAPIFLYDQLFAIGGAVRHLVFKPEPGTITCATFPGAVSCGPPLSIIVTQAQSLHLISKMVSCSGDEEVQAQLNCKFPSFPITSMGGIDQWGQPFGTIILDHMSAAIGAFSNRDGLNTGGYPYDPKAICPNVEFNEQFFPILYLYRKELADTGGAGKYRGGASATTCFTVHGTDKIDLSTAGCSTEIPTTTGLNGGYPAATNRYILGKGTNILELFAHGHMPNDMSELKGATQWLSPKQRNVFLRPGDVYQVYQGGAAGYGDPITRRPQAVAEDVKNGYVSYEASKSIYGVVIEKDTLIVNEELTKKLRDQIRLERMNPKSH